MKLWHILLGLGVVGVGGVVVYKVVQARKHPDDANSATRNPFRGTGLPCEADFDAQTTEAKAALVKLMNALPPDKRAVFLSCAPKPK